MEDFQNFNKAIKKFEDEHPGVNLVLAIKAYHVCHRIKPASIREISEHLTDRCSSCENWLDTNS